MSHKDYTKQFLGLTTLEVSNIWSSFLKNSMELCFLKYFYASTEDNEIKDVIEKMLNHAQENINELKEIFLEENLIVPIGFTDDDVTIGADKVFSDTFILYFCYDFTLLSLSTYTSAISDCSRKDIRNHFNESIIFSIKIQNEIIDLMISKGVYLRPPQLDLNNSVDFIDSKKYLSGLFNDSRALNAPEITNLTRIIHRAEFSKMILVAFNKLSTSKRSKQHYSKGRDEIKYVLNSLQEVVEKENIPISASGDYVIFDVESSPFSDKLMLFYVNTCLGMFCFTMIGKALNSSARSDILIKLTKISNKLKKYYGEGLLLSIKENWLEEPPQIVDRKI